MPKKQKIQKKFERKNKGITVIALVITIALNRCRGGHI